MIVTPRYAPAMTFCITLQMVMARDENCMRRIMHTQIANKEGCLSDVVPFFRVQGLTGPWILDLVFATAGTGTMAYKNEFYLFIGLVTTIMLLIIL